MKNKGCYILSILVAVLQGICACSQLVKVYVDRDTVEIGEHIHLKLKAEFSQQLDMQEWFKVADTFGHFEVIHRGRIDSVEANDFKIYEQEFIITSFDSGQWQIPEWAVAFRSDTGSNISKKTDVILIMILSPDVTGMKDINDIKDIITSPSVQNSSFPKFYVILLITIVLFLIVFYVLKNRKTKSQKPGDEEVSNPLLWASEQLTSLEKENLTAKEYYFRLYHICRKYYSIVFNKNVLHFTTEEWLVLLNSLRLSDELKGIFSKLLKKADSVRFTKEIDESKKMNETSIPKTLLAALDQIKVTSSENQIKP